MARAKNDVTDPRVQGHRGARAATSTTQAAPVLPQLLTTDEVAQALRVTPEYVTRRLVFERRIRFVKVGRRTLFDAADVRRFLDERRVTPQGYLGAEDTTTRHGRTT